MQQVLQRAGVVHTSSVENIPGAAGTIGLARFIGAERGNGDVVMVSGLIMLGAIVTHSSPVTLREVTPIARLTGEYEVIVVPAASPFQSLDDLVRAFRERPESISWGGGSAGGTDQMLAGLVADAVGVSPRRVNYIAFSGGGESMSAILGGQVSAGINGLAELAPQIDAGTVRALGISSAERLPGVPIPTFREQGVDVELENWRSLVAPPGISPVDRDRLEKAVDAMVRSAEWREALQRYRWIDRYLTGGEFTRFAQAEDQRVRAILTKLGLGSEQPTESASGMYSLLVLAGLAILRLCSGGRTRARPRGIIEQRRRGSRDPPSRCALRRASDGRSTMETDRVDCSRDGARPGADGAGRIRARLNGALLADGAGFRPSAPRTRRVVRARRLGRRIFSICSRAQRHTASRVYRALAVNGPTPTRSRLKADTTDMMDTLRALSLGFAGALTLPHLAWAFAGVTLGTAVGVLPGIGPALTIALLLPATFALEPTSAFITFAGIYYGAMYGGSTTSILLNTPGETASIVTAIDGHMMARQGRGAAALTTAAIGSFVAGTLATLALAFFAPPLASVALRFGPAEYFALTVVAFTTVSVLLGSSIARGLFSLFLGLALGLVGIDQLTGEARLSFGISQLLDGIDVVIFVIGLFAVGETLFQAWRHGRDEIEVLTLHDFTGMSRDDWKRSWKPWLRGTAIGFPLGVLPCGGSVIPTFLSYMVEKRLSREPERFGHGAIEGVAGPEAANNASAAGVLVPLLTLGLPSSATAAIMLAAFQQYGLQPGPLLFASRPDLVWTLVASLFIGNVMLLVLNLPLAGVWARVMLVPRRLLFGVILVLASLGAYSLNRSMLDLVMLFVIGVFGCAMRANDVPLAPAVIGLILGPMSEQQFRRALAISEGHFSVFVTRPISAALLVVALVVLTAPRLLTRWMPPRGEA